MFYDVSSWTLPYAFNLNHHYDNTVDLVGNEITELEAPLGQVTQKGSYAYLFEAHPYYTPKLLNYLHQNKVRVKVGLTPFTLDEKTFDYGTYMISAKKPAYQLEIDFGPLGILKSSAQITKRYALDELKGKQLIAVVNIGTRKVADFESQCLVLGANEKDTIILLAPETKLPNGQQIL